jgi:peptidoglycan/LPS O-acetylase OafA/YrhL
MFPKRSLAATLDSRNLDLLRAVAVSCVLGAHLLLCLVDEKVLHIASYDLWKWGTNELGHLGVLFFFVHTALVLMLSLERTPRAGMIVNFYLRRIFRIYPLSIACIALVLLLHIPQVPDASYSGWQWSEIASNLLLIQNITRRADVITPLWTLPREFQMYLVLPFIFLLLQRFRSSLAVLILWFGFFAAVPSMPLLSCFPCFMGGVFAYQLARERTFRLPSWTWPMAIALLLAAHVLAMATILPDYRSDYLLCMFLGAVIPNVADLRDSWMTSAAKTVAKYSYGIYLCHDPVLWFAFSKLGWLPLWIRWFIFAALMILAPICCVSLAGSADDRFRPAAGVAVEQFAENFGRAACGLLLKGVPVKPEISRVTVPGGRALRRNRWIARRVSWLPQDPAPFPPR